MTLTNAQGREGTGGMCVCVTKNGSLLLFMLIACFVRVSNFGFNFASHIAHTSRCHGAKGLHLTDCGTAKLTDCQSDLLTTW